MSTSATNIRSPIQTVQLASTINEEKLAKRPDDRAALSGKVTAAPIINDSISPASINDTTDAMEVKSQDYERLIARVHALPRELMYTILEYKLMSSLEEEQLRVNKDNVSINFHYKPPWQLSFSPVSRQKVSAFYYGRFTFHTSLIPGYSEKITRMWLASLSSKNRGAIKALKLVHRDKLRAFNSTPDEYSLARFKANSNELRQFVRKWFTEAGFSEVKIDAVRWEVQFHEVSQVKCYKVWMTHKELDKMHDEIKDSERSIADEFKWLRRRVGIDVKKEKFL
ncbi:hypothetical protein CBER1_05238 [Cercospora berteroae]|uniref:Uncharacterized protein n=1 Tax=Cercospora berteroae TaxID=357750 RepID=A0A2S6BT76_9PEZI|nr:hypothetical protein CBER1_05238 [Cercospora berteroae]